MVNEKFDTPDFGTPQVELQASLLAERTVSSILRLVTSLTGRSIPGAAAGSVTVQGLEGPFTSNYSLELALELDQIQYQHGVGPCVEAIRREAVVNEMLEGHHDWEHFISVADKHDVKSVLAMPLEAGGKVFGALNVYGTESKLFSADAVSTAKLLSEQAGVVLTNAIAFTGVETLNLQLREALESRDLIGQAKGILMERQGITADQAFEVLRRSSQRSNRKLNDMAQELVTRVAERGKPAAVNLPDA